MFSQLSFSSLARGNALTESIPPENFGLRHVEQEEKKKKKTYPNSRATACFTTIICVMPKQYPPVAHLCSICTYTCVHGQPGYLIMENIQFYFLGVVTLLIKLTGMP